MHFTWLGLVLPAATGVLGASIPAPRDDVSSAMDALANLAQVAFEEAQAQVQASGNETQKRSGTCSWQTVRIRREWGSLSRSERLAYINAVKCLQSKPAKTPAAVAAGAKSRFDDFIVTHIQQTYTIHYTGNFLSWHRYFTWQYEEALRNECGFKGTQPYWDWSKTAITGLQKSPIFDGSDTSMSGNGEFIPGLPDIILGLNSGLPPVYLPAGSGGGCVTSGPFKDMKVNLGPAALDTPGGVSETNPNGPFAYNPRCLRRSLTDEVNRGYANISAVLHLITHSNNVLDFQNEMQGVPGSGNIGVHGGGHYSIGGDPGRDVLTSPGDPVFYFHHGMIDRVWWIWQMLKPSQRVFSSSAVMGTNTFLNMPPSPDTTLNDMVDFGYAASPARKIGDLLSTLDGPFCYVYL